MDAPSFTPVILLSPTNELLMGEAQREARALCAQALREAQAHGWRPPSPACFAAGAASGWLRAIQTRRLDEVTTECVRMRELLHGDNQLVALANYEAAARTFEERCRQLEAALAQAQREVLRLQVQESRLYHELRAARESAAAESAVRITIAGGGCEAEDCRPETGGRRPDPAASSLQPRTAASAEADTHPIILPLPARPRGSWLRRVLRRLTRKEIVR